MSGHAYCVESYVQPAEGASALRDVLRTRCVRRDEINALGLKSIVSGTLTTCLMGAIVGMLTQP
ncbi:hypothetical protein BE61_43890 [Bradyrhizobium elkanii USDA 61]|nr:hypothetical protein BE61_43890 [Bradyrhizobium elkanii USDA 61]